VTGETKLANGTLYVREGFYAEINNPTLINIPALIMKEWVGKLHTGATEWGSRQILAELPL
jgi:hypothetical protein